MKLLARLSVSAFFVFSPLLSQVSTVTPRDAMHEEGIATFEKYREKSVWLNFVDTHYLEETGRATRDQVFFACERDNIDAMGSKRLKRFIIKGIDVEKHGISTLFHLMLASDSGEITSVWFLDEMSDDTFKKAFWLNDPINPKWTKAVQASVRKHQALIGMNKAQAIAALSYPDKVNITTTARAVHEQWIYGDTLIYFDNGRLTAIQDSE